MTGLTLGTRGSPLALAQANAVAAALEAAHGWASGTVAIRPIRTSGDRIQDRPLTEVGGKALWTKELDHALASGETDLSVHSMKDVESERPAEFAIAAMLERADPRDRLIGAESIESLPRGARVGTSSPRRTAQLRRLRPDLAIVPIRGNVATRLAKLEAGEADATILAAAGLDRLGHCDVGVPIEKSQMLPAVGQAAIGVECRACDEETARLVSAINHPETFDAVAAERAFCRALGGTCHSPIGVHAMVDGEDLLFACELLSEDGAELVVEAATFAPGDLAGPARLAQAMLAGAPPAIRSLFAET